MHFLITPLAIFFEDAFSLFINIENKLLLIYIPLTIFIFRDFLYLNVGFIDHFMLIEDRKLITKNTFKKLFPLEIYTILMDIIGMLTDNPKLVYNALLFKIFFVL